MATIKKIWFDDARIFIETADGTAYSQSMRFFPRLGRASDSERAEWKQSPFGLHWDALDEDISFESFLWGDNDPKTLYCRH